MSRSSDHVTIEMAEGAESDSEVNSAANRRLPQTRRWVTLSPDADSNRQLATRLNNIVYNFTPFLTHINSVNEQLNALANSTQTGILPPFLSRVPPRTRSLDNLSMPLHGPITDVRRNDEPHPNWENVQRNRLNDTTDPPTSTSEPEDDEEESDEHIHVNSRDLLALLPKLFKYAPVILILFTKFVIDHFFGIVSFMALILTFYQTNNTVKVEGMKPTDVNRKKLLIGFIQTIVAIFIVNLIEGYGGKYGGLLIMLPMYERPAGLWEMLWVVTITDLILKLITIDIKIILSSLPSRILPFKKKGKVYCFVETLSQLYRSGVPLQPWICFLLDSYGGYEKIIAVLLTSAYIVSKGFEITRRAITLRKSFDQLLKSTNIGVLPNKAQIDAAGKLCPICHEEYDTPVLLNCSHIFCEMCVSVWLNKVQTCPLCRAQVITSSTWRNGATSQYLQLY